MDVNEELKFFGNIQTKKWGEEVGGVGSSGESRERGGGQGGCE